MISVMKALYVVNYKIIGYMLLAVCFVACNNSADKFREALNAGSLSEAQIGRAHV